MDTDEEEEEALVVVFFFFFFVVVVVVVVVLIFALSSPWVLGGTGLVPLAATSRDRRGTFRRLPRGAAAAKQAEAGRDAEVEVFAFSLSITVVGGSSVAPQLCISMAFVASPLAVRLMR